MKRILKYDINIKRIDKIYYLLYIQFSCSIADWKEKRKMNIKYKSLKNTEAITLIALVITIILILILAGISITMLSGDNGIINKAIESKDNTNIKQEIEKIQLAVMGSINEDRIIHADDLKKSLQGIVEDASAIKENAPWVVNGKDTGK